VFAIILLVALGEGARQYLADTFASLGSNLVQIFPGRRETAGIGQVPVAGTEHKLTREDEEAIRRRANTIDAVGVLSGVVPARRAPISIRSKRCASNDQICDVARCTQGRGRGPPGILKV
jgi:putative ABC transport system permease protein